MNKLKIVLLILVCIGINTLSAQVVKKDTKIRFNVGMSSFSSSELNEIADDLKEASFLINSYSKFLSPKFSQHLLVSADYEIKIDNNWSYLFTIEYHNAIVSTENVDNIRLISQAFSYEITFAVAGLSLAYYHPVFNSDFGYAHLFAGVGLDLFYADLNLDHYFYEYPKDGEQTIKYRGTSYNPGGKCFVGFEIPFTPTIFVKLQTGFSYRVINDLSGKIELNKPEPFSQSLFKRESYNISGVWGTLGIAYLF
jgi:hypothetical protein